MKNIPTAIALLAAISAPIIALAGSSSPASSTQCAVITPVMQHAADAAARKAAQEAAAEQFRLVTSGP